VKVEKTDSEPSKIAPSFAENFQIFDAVRAGVDFEPLLNDMSYDALTIVDDTGLSALHHAVDAEQPEAVKALLEAKADVDALDGQKATALHYAALLGSESIVAMLLDAGATPLAHDDDGKSAAQLAQEEGYDALAMRIKAAEAERAGAAAAGSLPVIDIGAFMRGSAAERASIAASFDDAFCSLGFCQVAGYEALLAETTITDLREHASDFFALPAEAKRLTRADGLVGYLAPGEETVSDSSAADASVAAPPSGSSNEADPVESLNLPGYQEEGATWRASAAEAECPWVQAPWMTSAPAGLRSAALAYWGGATRLMSALMRLMAAALDLADGHFEDPFEKPGTLLRIAWYPAVPAASTEQEGAETAAEGLSSPQLRYGEHTDYDGFTILQRSGDSGGGGGLQIQMPSGEWTSVPSSPGTLTINIGDLFARWTNDRWRATKHRVVARRPSATAEIPARLSIVYFSGPHPDTVVTCLPCPKCQSDAARYEPITAGAHVEAKMKAATAAARGDTVHPR